MNILNDENIYFQLIGIHLVPTIHFPDTIPRTGAPSMKKMKIPAAFTELVF